MRVWLDDERDPKDPFIQQRFGAKGDEVWVKHTWDVKDLILAGNVEFVSFDNDLTSGEPEGKDLAKWIEEQAFNKAIPPMKWAVHTQNPAARKEIIAAMKNAERFWSES